MNPAARFREHSVPDPDAFRHISARIIDVDVAWRDDGIVFQVNT
jgi:hypothetical protein